MEAAQTRPRMKNRNLDLYLQNVGQLMLHRYLQFYNGQRSFRITNKEGFPEYVQMYMEGDFPNKQVSVQRTTMTPQGAVAQPQQQMSVKGEPDIRVSSGSALPFAKAQKAQTAIQYFQAGAIDEEELLKSVDWPNYEEVLKRVEERKQQMAQQAAQEQAAKV